MTATIRAAVAEVNSLGYLTDTTRSLLTPSEAALVLQLAGDSA